MRQFTSDEKRIHREIKEAANRISKLAARRTSLPKHIPLAESKHEQDIIKPATERKHLTNVLKMVAYQIESDLVERLRPHYARADDEGRTLIQTALQSAASIEPGMKIKSGKIWTPQNLDKIWTPKVSQGFPRFSQGLPPKVCQSNRGRILGKVLLDKFWALINVIGEFGRL